MSPSVRASLELLGVELGASAGELKKAYRKLALLYHPDRNSQKTAAAEFQKITEAYDLLLDPARVAELNRTELARRRRDRFGRQVVDGLEITFGSFFGYRTFDPREATARKPAKLLPGRSTGQRRVDPGVDWRPIEENNSVLDNAAFDAIEAVYAGRFSIADEERLLTGEARRAAQLPWVVLNNQGILRFFEGDLRGAKACYEELNQRIPNNILFMYRLALCLILEAFRMPRRTLLGTMKPDRIKVERAIALLRHAIKLGETRPIGRQRCLVVRKTLADVLERTGQRARARRLWRAILVEDPACVEAAFKAGRSDDARRLLQRRLTEMAGGDRSSPPRLPGR